MIERRIFICILSLLAGGSAFAQNANVPGPHSAISQFVIDGVALGARIEFASSTFRGYQCSPSEQFLELNWCQRIQKQQDGGARRYFEATNSILHTRDGKAIYISRYIAPSTLARNEIQNEINKLSSKFGERAREMRMPEREGLPTAIIALWGKVQLEQLDVNAISILGSGESPRKGLLIDYLGNFRRSAQLGLPIYRLSGGAGYLWSASVDRNDRGHLRLLAIDASELTPAAATKPPAVESREIEKVATDAHPEAQETTIINEADIEKSIPPEGAKVGVLLARLESDLAASEANNRAMETLAYRAVAGLIALLIVASFLLLRRKKANAAKQPVYKSEIKPLNPVLPEGIQVTSSRCESETLDQKSVMAGNATASHEQCISEVRFQNGSDQKTEFAHKDIKLRAHERESVQAGEINMERPKPLPSNLRPCAHCNREISIEDKFCMHCGVSVASRVVGKTRLCASCCQEIGAADNFCRYCGGGSIAVVAPSMKPRRKTRVRKQPVEHEPNVGKNIVPVVGS
jgi:hypothetical protein